MKFRRIKDLREDHDLLQRDVAKLLGISQQYYSEYENGKRTIPIQHLITLADYYKTSIDYIVERVNEYSFYVQNKKRKQFK
jgi:transcriptional regulator with XRE-family HTH domain